MSYLVPASVETALDELGIDYTANDDEASACCPFHNERHPSWGINLATGQHHCFTCGASGGFVSLVQHVKQVRREDAVLWTQEHRSTEIYIRRKEDDTLKLMNEAKLALFVPPPVQVLKGRGISPSAAAKLGILWDEDKELWITPVRDPMTGELWGWQEKANEGRYFRNRPKDVRKSRSLFGLHCFSPGGTAVLVESPLDVARLLTVGVKGGVASYGAGVSVRQLDLLARFAKRVVLALDYDHAGLKRTVEILAERPDIQLTIFNYKLAPGGKDPGDMSATEIRDGIEKATSRITTRFNLNDHC